MDTPRLLVLDDDALIAQTIAAAADSLGAQARCAGDPQDFFGLLREWQPTHLCVDLNMPVVDGLTVLAELGRLGCRARVIVGSGVDPRVLASAARTAQAHGLDVAGVLPKPFTLAELRRLLQADAAAPGQPGPGRGGAFLPSPDDLRVALERRQLQVHYQPKLDCRDGSLSGFEALVRWAHPEHGLLLPERFIELAERAGLIDTLTEQVVEQAVAWFVPWTARQVPGREVSLAVNLSARSLSSRALFERIRRMCSAGGMPPNRLCFELTESAAMDDPALALELLTRLRMQGFQLSIDDFGTGFSSMVQLVRLPFSELKVDRSFVASALESRESRTVIRCMLDLARSLGLSVVAEGVADQRTLELLASMGCHTVQGFLLGRPMEAAEVSVWHAALVQRRAGASTAPG